MYRKREGNVRSCARDKGIHRRDTARALPANPTRSVAWFVRFKRRMRSFTDTTVGRDATPDAGEDARTTPPATSERNLRVDAQKSLIRTSSCATCGKNRASSKFAHLEFLRRPPAFRASRSNAGACP